MRLDVISFVLLLSFIACALPAFAQPLGEPDRGAPGDEMIQAYLAQETAKLSAKFNDDVKSLADWEAKRPQYIEEYFYMLGLSPRPDMSPLEAKTTGTHEGEGFVVEMVHYQSRPKLYVTGNLYRPAKVKEGEGKKLPAVFYVCGHSGRGRNGNKVAYQSHGIWFARHGYVCLVVDSLQLGEIAATHHGTYNLQRWWWHSRGYTPAGVEAWNGMRGIDYLVGRPDVDSARIAVTGISGGGAATFWVAAADERVKVAVPVSGMADLESYVPNRVINGHCDCMFLYNTFQWPWTRIAGLVAPRPMLFINSDQDGIFPMDANERISNRLERLYSLYGAGDSVDAVVSVGGHAYRKDIRQAAYRFINTHLKSDSRPVADSEADIVSEGGSPGPYPIPPEKLRVFPTDADLPADQLNTKIDEHFVPLAKVSPPEPGKFEQWKKPLLAELKRVSFGYFPERIPVATQDNNEDPFETEVGVKMRAEERVRFKLLYNAKRFPKSPKSRLLIVLSDEEAGTKPEWVASVAMADQEVYYCEPRGVGETKWTRKNGPNYIERSLALLGRTADSGRVYDVIAASRFITREVPVHIAGRGPAGLIAAYAAILSPEIASVTLVSPSASHMEPAAPQFLNVLRVCDVPESLGLLAPRPLTILDSPTDRFTATKTAYKAAGAEERLSFK